MRIIANTKSSWEELGKKVLSKKQQDRIKRMVAHSELDLDGHSPFREVLFRSWIYTDMGKGDVNNHPSEDWILGSRLQTLVDIYKDVDFDKVMDKLDYIK